MAWHYPLEAAMGKRDKHQFIGAPVQIGSDVFTRLCMPVIREATLKAKPTAQQMGQLYAGFIGACVGSMVADVGKEQALAWARQTLDMVESSDFDDVTNPGGIHERKGH
jgi:hypothetical protein